MSFIAWKSEYNTGLRVIDEQHRVLAAAINSLYDASNSSNREKAIEKAFYTLMAYIKFHFKAEEDLMSGYGYDGYESHKKEHESIAAELVSRHNDFDTYGSDVYADLLTFLRRWFMNHTQATDREYVPLFKSLHLTEQHSRDVRDQAEEAHAEAKALDVVPLIQWTEGYNIGLKDIDIEHKHLADTINLVYSSFLNPGNHQLVEEAFKQLDHYVEHHFTNEEVKQKKHGYPKHAKHADEHAKFVRQVADLKFKFSKFKTVVDYDLLIMLRDWFINHTQTADREYVPYLKVGE